MTIIGTPSFRRCSYTTGPIIGHYVKLRCHPSTQKKSAWEPFFISHRVRLLFGLRESGKGSAAIALNNFAQPTKTVSRQIPVYKAKWQAHQWRFALFPPCRRCVPSRTNIGLAVFTSLCASFLDAGRASHRKRIFYRSSAAASVPFRRLSAHSPGWRFPTLRIGRPNLDLRSRFGQPMHNPKSLSVLIPPQRLLHSTTASALANPKRSADHNTPH